MSLFLDFFIYCTVWRREAAIWEIFVFLSTWRNKTYSQQVRVSPLALLWD